MPRPSPAKKIGGSSTDGGFSTSRDHHSTDIQSLRDFTIFNPQARCHDKEFVSNVYEP
ncbi:MAG: hypothetical protein WC139_07590 [Candidatus Kapaibacterium sp.]